MDIILSDASLSEKQSQAEEYIRQVPKILEGLSVTNPKDFYFSQKLNKKIEEAKDSHIYKIAREMIKDLNFQKEELHNQYIEFVVVKHTKDSPRGFKLVPVQSFNPEVDRIDVSYYLQKSVQPILERYLDIYELFQGGQVKKLLGNSKIKPPPPKQVEGQRLLCLRCKRPFNPQILNLQQVQSQKALCPNQACGLQFTHQIIPSLLL